MVKIAYVPTRRSVFSRDDALKYKVLVRDKLKESVRDLDVRIIDIEGLNEEGLLYDDRATERAVVDRLRREAVDGIFFPHVNFGCEEAVAGVAQAVNVPVLLWGPRDEGPLADGMRLRDTQCGLFATGKVLRRFGVTFDYIVNSRVEDGVFVRGVSNFVRVCNVIKEIRRLQILQIGPRPASFLTMMCNESELLEKFGVRIHPITVDEIASATLAAEARVDDELISVMNYIRSALDCRKVEEGAVRRVAALKTVIKRLAGDTGSTAVVLQCWTSLQDRLGVMPCLANALLFDEQIPVACETDVHGAISSVLAQAADLNRKPVFFADLTIRHPENDNGELLFHCGNFPLSLSSGGSHTFDRHFLFESHAPGTHEGPVKGGRVSLCRFDGDHGRYSLFLGRARGIDGPFSRGSYLWVEVNDWPLWEEKLVTGPYVHHIAGIHANIIPVLHEACKYLPGVDPDPVDPSEAEIKAWLRGKDVEL